jgi:hypothetical protein
MRIAHLEGGAGADCASGEGRQLDRQSFRPGTGSDCIGTVAACEVGGLEAIAAKLDIVSWYHASVSTANKAHNMD